MDDVVVMAWTSSEIEQQVERDPNLGIALSQYLVAQCMALQDRIQSAACYKIRRIMVALAQLATHLGAAMPDGTTRIPGTTHHVTGAVCRDVARNRYISYEPVAADGNDDVLAKAY